MRCRIRQLTLLATATLTPVLTLAQQTLTNEQGELMMVEMDDPFGPAPAVAAIGFFAAIIAAMFFAFQRERRRQDFLLRFVEKEQPIPAELLPPQPSRVRELRRGVWLLCLGLGLGLLLYILSEEWTYAAWSLILLFLALASFINAALFYPDSPTSPSRTLERPGNGA